MPRNNLGTSQVSVDVVPTLIISANGTRVGVLVTQLGTTDVYVGNSNVTTTTGSLLPGTKGAALSLPFLGDVYGIAAGAPQTVSVLEVFN